MDEGLNCERGFWAFFSQLPFLNRTESMIKGSPLCCGLAGSRSIATSFFFFEMRQLIDSALKN